MKLEEALIATIKDAGLGVIGTTLFQSHMPAECKAGILVLARVPIMIDPYTGLRKGPFQVIVRAPKITEAHQKATLVMKALMTEGTQKGGVTFKFIKPEHEPLVFPRTEGSQFEASVNYNFAASWE